MRVSWWWLPQFFLAPGWLNHVRGRGGMMEKASLGLRPWKPELTEEVVRMKTNL
jgi:hypothetical protein